MLEGGQLQSVVRKSARALWWLLTPWNYKARIAYLRVRAQVRHRAAELSDLAHFEMSRRTLSLAANDASQFLPLFDAHALAQLANVSVNTVRLSVPSPSKLYDTRAAAAFVLGLWHTEREVRARFPALFRGNGTAFLAWLRDEGRALVSLLESDLVQIESLFESDYSARARQLYLAQPDLRVLLPHGLTPPGMAALFRWFARVMLKETELVLEEVLWLFLRAGQGPAEELLTAHAFSSEWQRLHPDGTTAFGREALSRWFGQLYDIQAAWLDSATWPEWMDADAQVRTSYWAREAWQAEHPNAFRSEAAARALLDWLASGAAPISERAHTWSVRNRSQELATSLAGLGMNVIGHFTYPSGLRVSVESLVQAAKSSGIALALRDIRTDAKDDPNHVDFRGPECHDVTVIHTQPYPYFDDVYARADLAPRESRTYRIAYWYWEFDSIPDSWLVQAAQVDEVWAATEFVAKGLRDHLPLPVRTLFPGVKLSAYEERSRAHFGLQDGQYIFLFTFHMMSVMERKNPLGLIQAFREAFSPEEPVCLVLKTSFGDRHLAQIDELRAAALGANIQIIDAVFSPDEVLSLMATCDAYISLHRSEGLGLTMAEAMLLAKPVIATQYSGNVDFMDETNSVLVPYTLKKLGRPIPPYDADLEWAEPSLEYATEAMRRLFENQDWARELGRRGQASAQQSLSLEAAGRKIAARLEEIRVWLGTECKP